MQYDINNTALVPYIIADKTLRKVIDIFLYLKLVKVIHILMNTYLILQLLQRICQVFVKD